MSTTDFETALTGAGYRDVTTRTMEPRPANGDHTHEFSVRGLVSAGEFIITTAGMARSYRAGDVFEVGLRRAVRKLARQAEAQTPGRKGARP